MKPRAKEKAIQLIRKYMNTDYTNMGIIGAKECALMAVDETISVLIQISKEESGTTSIDYGQDFYEQVKLEIEKL